MDLKINQLQLFNITWFKDLNKRLHITLTYTINTWLNANDCPYLVSLTPIFTLISGFTSCWIFSTMRSWKWGWNLYRDPSTATVTSCLSILFRRAATPTKTREYFRFLILWWYIILQLCHFESNCKNMKLQEPNYCCIYNYIQFPTVRK